MNKLYKITYLLSKDRRRFKIMSWDVTKQTPQSFVLSDNRLIKAKKVNIAEFSDKFNESIEHMFIQCWATEEYLETMKIEVLKLAEKRFKEIKETFEQISLEFNAPIRDVLVEHQN